MPAGATTQPTRQPIIRSSLDAEPTVMSRSARPGCDAGMHGRAVVEPDALHRRVVDHPRVVLARTGPASASRCALSSTGPVGMAGPIISTAAVCGPTAAASSLGVDAPASGRGPAGTKRGYAARQPDPVDQAA